MTLTFLFVYCFLFVNYYSKILLQLCQLYRTGQFVLELTLYQTLEQWPNSVWIGNDLKMIHTKKRSFWRSTNFDHLPLMCLVKDNKKQEQAWTSGLGVVTKEPPLVCVRPCKVW